LTYVAITFFSDRAVDSPAAGSLWRNYLCPNAGSTGSLIVGDNRLQVPNLRLLWRLE
jgi:hypothetical protein